jgi:hypothetical protein
MVEEVTYQMVLSTLQTIALIVGIVYYLIIMRNSQRNQKIQIETRQAQLFMQIFTRQYDVDQRRNLHLVTHLEYKNYDDFIEKYGAVNNPDVYFRFSSLCTYFEGVGVLVKRNLVDPSIVDDLMSGRIIEFWEAVSPYILAFRERTGDYEAIEHVEYLYTIIKSIQDKQRIAAGLPIR